MNGSRTACLQSDKHCASHHHSKTHLHLCIRKLGPRAGPESLSQSGSWWRLENAFCTWFQKPRAENVSFLQGWLPRGAEDGSSACEQYQVTTCRYWHRCQQHNHEVCHGCNWTCGLQQGFQDLQDLWWLRHRSDLWSAEGRYSYKAWDSIICCQDVPVRHMIRFCSGCSYCLDLLCLCELKQVSWCSNAQTQVQVLANSSTSYC